MKLATSDVGARARAVAARLRRRIRRTQTARVRIRTALGLPPIEPLARVIFEFARVRPDAFVVQVGSHDSSQLDPLRPYILSTRWRGVLVEPIPAVFARLVDNYAGVDGLIFENAAIAHLDGTIQLYHLPQSDDEGLPPWYDALATFRKEVLLNHERFIPDVGRRIETIEVPCLTFDSLCRKHAIDKIDLVHIDAEGYDMEILRQIDFARYSPALVQFEELHLDEDARRASVELLEGHGYEAIGNGMDCLCFDRSRVGPSSDRLVRTWRRVRKDPSIRRP